MYEILFKRSYHSLLRYKKSLQLHIFVLWLIIYGNDSHSQYFATAWIGNFALLVSDLTGVAAVMQSCISLVLNHV